jgi:hypothetical protein
MSASTGLIGSTTSSTLIADLSINESLYSFDDSTTPGLSIIIMFLSNYISCIDLVIPGVFPVGAALLLFNELIKDDLPTFGYPMIPTTIYCLYLLLYPSTLA